MKYFSTFSGIGGFELGIKQAYEDKIGNQEQVSGEKSIQDRRNNMLSTSEVRKDRNEYPTCIGYSEIDKYAVQVYEKHFNHKNYGDITKIVADELPDFDLLVGGFPCQSFSIAGKRGGFKDTRGTLFFDLARILQAKKPSYFIFENVKGLLNHDKGNTFATILTAITELGYDCQWQVLNSKNFGVPQNRERVFIVGNLRGTSRPEVFPITGTNSNSIEVVGELNSKTWKKRNESIRRVYGTDGISPTIPTAQGGGVMAKIMEQRSDEGLRVFKDNICGTIRTIRDGGDKRVVRGNKIRRLTPKECERLQGFPDDWTDCVSDTQRYKCCGNAVTVNVVREVVKRLL